MPADITKEPPRCPVAEVCGGCSAINVAYEQQLAEKECFLDELFSGGSERTPEPAIVPLERRKMLGMEYPYHYRNKVISPFAPGPGVRPARKDAKGSGKKNGFAAADGATIMYGMYAAGTHRIIQADECLTEHVCAREIVRAVASLMRRYHMSPYDENTGSGFMRHAVIRAAHHTGEILLTLVTNTETFTGSRNFCRELKKRCPYITSIVQNINTRQTNVILGEKERVLYGPGFILDELCGLSFKISSHSFYQVNAEQTEVLYRSAIELAHLEPGQQVLDAYCGTGTIGLAAVRASECTLVGVDNVASAIADARDNARHNGIDARFVVADAADFLREEARVGAHYDVVFLDPPRSGCSSEFCRALIALAPSRIVYISCNPVTQLRDLRVFVDGGFSVDVLVPVDMFPHTPHVETVVLMSRVGV